MDEIKTQTYNKSMNPNTAKNALVFLSRVDLKGAEVTPFQEVVQALNAFTEETLTMTAPEEETTTSTTPTDNA